jgi:acyl-CoA synthetase (AMP-forming)/AMP-acid ligase II
MSIQNGIDPSVAAHAGGLTLGDMLRARARQYPGRTAIVDGGRSFTYAALNARVNRLAALLRRLDIGRGDRVAILSENRAEYLELMFAAGKVGAIVCALNWRLADPELIHCVTLTSPKASFVPRHTKLPQPAWPPFWAS